MKIRYCLKYQEKDSEQLRRLVQVPRPAVTLSRSQTRVNMGLLSALWVVVMIHDDKLVMSRYRNTQKKYMALRNLPKPRLGCQPHSEQMVIGQHASACERLD